MSLYTISSNTDALKEIKVKGKENRDSYCLFTFWCTIYDGGTTFHEGLVMYDQKFTYNISRKDSTHIPIHKYIRTVIRIFADGEGYITLITWFLHLGSVILVSINDFALYYFVYCILRAATAISLLSESNGEPASQ